LENNAATSSFWGSCCVLNNSEDKSGV